MDVSAHIVTSQRSYGQGKPGKYYQRRVAVLFYDISEQKRAEERLERLNETLEQQVAERTELAEARAKQLQALAVELIEAEERERRRVAGLLHDDLQQILASARMQLGTCDLSSDPVLPHVEQLLTEAIDKSRRLSHELSPAVLHHSGLSASLQWLAKHMEESFGLQVRLGVNATEEVDSSTKLFLFRAVQELLFNVVKHAGVKSARVDLSSEKNRGLLLTVQDAGKGFDPTILHNRDISGFGLLTLMERSNYIGGSFGVESAPGRGSRFTLTVPIRQAI